jgi:hypothetical protein
VASSHLKYVWITHSKCRSAMQLEQQQQQQQPPPPH